MEEELSPTLKSLDQERSTENLAGTALQKKKTLFGKEYCFYNDGSVLVVDPTKQEYHFLTREGRSAGKDLRQRAADLIRDESKLENLKFLGEGKAGFSKVYEMETDVGPIAVKTTDKVRFLMKELMEEASRNAKQSDLMESMSRPSSRKIVQKMSLKTTMQLFKKLDTRGIKKPEFYGFTVRRDTSTHEIQEFQFMEAIDRPTVYSIFDSVATIQNKETGEVNIAQLPYPELLQQMANKYYGGDTIALLKAIAVSFSDFVRATKAAVPHIADLEMDNIFLVGYDRKTQQPDFMLIDPIEEEILLRPIQTSNSKNIIHNKDCLDKI